MGPMKKMVCHTLDIGWKTHTLGLTIGKSYEIIEESPEYVSSIKESISYRILVVRNDECQDQRYSSLLFKEMQEWREERLERLGI